MNPARCLVPRRAAPASSSLRRILEDRDLPGIPPSPSGGRTACGIAWSRVPSLMVCLRLTARPLWGRRCLRGYHGLPATKHCPRHCALSQRSLYTFSLPAHATTHACASLRKRPLHRHRRSVGLFSAPDLAGAFQHPVFPLYLTFPMALRTVRLD